MVNKYRLKLTVKGAKQDDLVADYQKYLAMRPHLEEPNVILEENGDLKFEITYQAPDPIFARKQVTEEMFELNNAILYEIEGVTIEDITVEQI